MKEPPSEGPDDWYFDESLQQWLRHSGRAKWRAILAERRTDRDPAADQAFLDRYGLRRVETPGGGVTIVGMEPQAGLEPTRPPNAAERFMALLGRPLPAWTAQDEARYQQKMDRADADLRAVIERRNRGLSAA